MVDYSIINGSIAVARVLVIKKKYKEVLYSPQPSLIFNLSIKSIYLVLDNSTSWTQGYIHLGDGHF